MLVLGPYEIILVVSVLLLLTFGPVLAGLVLAGVRGFWKRLRHGSNPPEDSP